LQYSLTSLFANPHALRSRDMVSLWWILIVTHSIQYRFSWHPTFNTQRQKGEKSGAQSSSDVGKHEVPFRVLTGDSRMLNSSAQFVTLLAPRIFR